MKISKLSKDQIQKIILSAIGFVGLIYCYFNFFLTPLNKSRETMSKAIADLQAKTASSKTEMRKTANLESQAKEATSRYKALQAMTAEGAPIAWYPPKIRSLFAGQGIDKASARLDRTTDFKEPELADWVKNSWQVEISQAGFNALGRAIAELENTEPLASIQSLVIHAVPEDPELQHVSMSLQTVFVKK